MKVTVGVVFAVVVTSLSGLARAQEANATACSDAYTSSQVLRNDRKLLRARDALRTCVQLSCKDFIARDCTTWLDEVQASVPTVVPVATDEAGNGLVGVKVSMDGTVLLGNVDGRSVEVDPGSHTFRFEAADGTTAEKQVVVSEGEKGTHVGVVLAKPAPPAPASAPPAVAAPASSTPSAPAPATEAGAGQQVTGWVLGGLGVAAGIGGIAVATAGQGKHNDALALAANNYDAGANVGAARDQESQANTMKTAGYLMTGGGAVLLASGVVVLLTSHPHPNPPTSAIWTPWLSATGAGGALTTSW